MQDILHYADLLRRAIHADYRGMYRAASGSLLYPFIVPGSASYANCLWDWDSWLTNIALRQILLEAEDPEQTAVAEEHERGCILNFLHYTDGTGWMPIMIDAGRDPIQDRPADWMNTNMHKPVLAQHAAFLCDQYGGDAEWMRTSFPKMQAFVNNYSNHHRHACGLYFWQDDYAIGVDNDPSTYYRPKRSSGSIYLNCLMYRELLAIGHIADLLNQSDIGDLYRRDADRLLGAIRTHCWDEKDGMYYSVDLNLLPIDHTHWLHRNMPRDWDCLIQRIGCWSGFLALWAGIATADQAERIVRENLLDPRGFWADFGVRTLARYEKMYNVRASGNPSSWLGPVWGISNYMVFRGLVQYGYHMEAKELASRTVRLFGRDIERFGAMHEYYLPDNGEPVLNRGFQNWNYLVLNMIAWLQDRPVITEF